jgi:hypothetical protein
MATKMPIPVKEIILFLATIFLAIVTRFISLKSSISIEPALPIHVASSFIAIG